MTPLTLIYLLAGLLLLALGAESLIRGAAQIAERLGISSLVIGLTVVAFGTSAPELAVSVQASLSGSGDIAVGNVIGSNIANILLILGLAALLAPLMVARQLIRLDVPVMVAAGALTLVLAWDGRISRGDGCMLLAGMLLYALFLLMAGKRQQRLALNGRAESERGPASAPGGWLRHIFLVLMGLGLLVLGSQLLIEGAISLARALGLSELVIGLTVVAVGTSLPELATSLLALYRGERGIAVGNVVGSCVLNLLLVLGASAVVVLEGLSISPNALAFDLPVMFAVFVACIPIFFTGYRINRWEGALLLGYYLAYTLYLAMLSTGLPAIELLRHVMIWYVMPITGITLAVASLRAWKVQR